MHLPDHKCFAHYVTAENPTCPADDGQNRCCSFQLPVRTEAAIKANGSTSTRRPASRSIFQKP